MFAIIITVLVKTFYKDNTSQPLDYVDFAVNCTRNSAEVSWSPNSGQSTCSALDWGYDCFNASQVMRCQSLLLLYLVAVWLV